MKISVLKLILGCLALEAMGPVARADWQTLFEAGADNGDYSDLAPYDGVGNAAPGSAQNPLDDDTYLAGVYPPPIGVVVAPEMTSAINGKPTLAIGHGLGGRESKHRVHFNLSAAEASPQAKIRVLIDTVQHRWVKNNQVQLNGVHSVALRLNGNLIRPVFDILDEGVVVTELPVGTGWLQTGQNVFEWERVGGSADGNLMMDWLKFELNPTALRDGDGDGLPEWWEEENGLSDANPDDAARDVDGDGLTAIQEMARGSHPNRMDSDGDGLVDNLEPGLPGGTSPRLQDTDGDSIPDKEEESIAAALSGDADADGVPDTWEKHQKSQVLNAGDAAPLLRRVIGLKFNHDQRRGRAMERYRIGGVVPQMNWTNSRPLSLNNGNIGDTSDIAGPLAGVFSDGAGIGTAMAVTWSSSVPGFSGNNTEGPGRLLDAHLKASGTSPAVVSFSGVPYALYDVYVYLSGGEFQLTSKVELMGNQTGQRWLKVNAAQPVDTFTEGRGVQPSLSVPANYVRFREVTGSSFSAILTSVNDRTSGISAIQIVDIQADMEPDGVPDWYESKYGLKLGVNDRTGDPDGDGLDNGSEATKGTNPFSPDSDGDGFSDFVENGSGVYAGINQPGTDPLNADTDGDGLKDGDEAFGAAFFSHPLLPDTDFDGVSDAAERKANSDPNVTASSQRMVPVRDQGTGSWTWSLDGLQLIWNHQGGDPTLGNGAIDRLFSITVRNGASALFSNAWRFAMDQRSDGLHWAVEAGPGVMRHALAADGDGYVKVAVAGASSLLGPMGFTGVGTMDMSDRLRVRMDLIPPVATQTVWTLRLRIWNTDRDAATPLVDVSDSNLRLDNTMVNNAAYWVSGGTPSRYQEFLTETRSGTSLFFSQTRLDGTAAFAAGKDADEDGLPDWWEYRYAGDPADPADSSLDDDGDGLSRLQEYLAGTHPLISDTDGDGVSDAAELRGRSDPLSNSSRPWLWQGAGSPALAGDFNSNGLSDVWEAAFGAGTLQQSGDADNDGQSNLAESIAGTDPFNPADFPAIQQIQSVAGMLQFQWQGNQGKRYSLLKSGDLQSWQPAPGGAILNPTAPGTLSMEIPRPAGIDASFYRISIQDRDSDNDGVNDWTEALIGTDPLRAGSTGSSIPWDQNADGVPEFSLDGDYGRLAALASDFGADTALPIPANISPAMASRFLTQATFGPDPESIRKIQAMGYEAWLNDQILYQPAYYHKPWLEEVREDLIGPRIKTGYDILPDTLGPIPSPENLHTPFLRAALQSGDQLRQRMAFALSQIMVVSRRDAGLYYQAEGLADYYDILVRNAFGNYRDILMEVSLHPVMGRYLSHIGNQKARPEFSQFPDENYAREIMQLFTIGLWELNPDGSRKLTADGNSIPTYGNSEITELARVFTGFWYGGQEWGVGGGRAGEFTQPMEMHPERHDFGLKRLTGGKFIPARSYSKASALQDVGDAVDHLFNHANTPPFVCRQLIQFLVTANPSPAYIRRVQDVFVNDGNGVRGNLGAVSKAILLDPEARSSALLLTSRKTGYLKEPLLRFISMARAFGAGRGENNLQWWDSGYFLNNVQQRPLYAPSVFNYFRPDYTPPGLLTQEGLRAPVFQITDSSTTLTVPNVLWDALRNGIRHPEAYQYPIPLETETRLAAEPGLLMDHLDVLLCQGLMDPVTRSAILAAVNQIPSSRPATRARMAVWLTLCSPDGAVLR